MPSDARRVMLFDLYSNGHHEQYLSQLARYWVRCKYPGRLDIVVPSYFIEEHPALSDFVNEHHHEAGIRLVPIREQVFVQAQRRFQLVRNDLEHGRLLEKYITALKPDHCVLMYFDHAQLSLAKKLRFEFPVELSGIYFRPSFHYKEFHNDQSGLKEAIKRLRKRLVLKAALRNPHFKTLLCLDPYVVPHIKSRTTRAVFLADGIERTSSDATTESTRRCWAVEEGRKVVLFFGGINSRKGIFQVLAAIRILDVDIQKKLCLVLVGKIADHEAEKIKTLLKVCRQTSTVQIILRDEFVEENEIQGIIRGADLALITYQRHIGSSGVLIRAAEEQVPVLGSDYGLVGENIRRYSLGLSVDTTSSYSICSGLTLFITDPDKMYFSSAKARIFASENSAEQFCSTIFNYATVFRPDLPRL